jgi:hypothetical protein
MRMHPVRPTVSTHPNVIPVLMDLEQEEMLKERRDRKPIVSINGKDVDDETPREREVA